MRPHLPLALLLLGAALPAAAQIPVPPTPVPAPVAGPFGNTSVRVSAGYGYGGPAAVGDTDRTHGITLGLAAERPLLPQLTGIVEGSWWKSSTNPSSAAFLTGSLALYPVPGFDGYVRAGLGYGKASLSASDVTISGGSYSVSGLALQLGAGYDYRIAPRTGLGVFVQASNTLGGSARHLVRYGSGEIALISFGLSATVRW